MARAPQQSWYVVEFWLGNPMRKKGGLLVCIWRQHVSHTRTRCEACERGRIPPATRRTYPPNPFP